MKLKKYQDWKLIKESELGKEPAQVKNFINNWPWSASFISFVYKQADPSFPSARGHTTYATSLKSNPNWETLDPAITPLKLGDIIVRNRKGNNQRFQQNTWGGLSHGDIIVELNPNSAKKVGGNTGSGSDKVCETEVSLNKGIIAEKGFFVVLRPKNEQVALNAVEIAKAENEIWTTNKWTEHNTSCHTRLQAYYNAAQLSIPGYDKVDPSTIALTKDSKIKTVPPSTGETEISTGRKIYTLLNVMGEFMVMNGMWVGKLFTLLPEPSKGGPSLANKFKMSDEWVPLEKFCELTAKLDKEHPGARTSADIELNRQKFCSTPEIAQKSADEWMKELGNKTSPIMPGDEELARAEKEESEESVVTTENCQISIPKSKKKGFLSDILDFSDDTYEEPEIENIIIVYPGSEEKSGFNTLDKLKGLLSGKFSDISEKFVVVFANRYDTDFENIREDIQKEVDNVDEYTDYTLILFGHSAQNTDIIEDLSSTQNIKGVYLINPVPTSSMVSSITKLSPDVKTGIYYSPGVWQTKEDKSMYLLNAISTHLKKSGKNESDFISKVKSKNLEESIEKGLNFFKDKIDYTA